MTEFLKLVAEDLVKRFGDAISDLTLVFPNQRARLFFHRHLSAYLTKPIWSPRVTTISEMMQDISGFQYDDPINLVTKLFLVYREVKNSDESFDNFYFWGEVMLADFDQIDKYMVDAQSLFINIRDIKDIEERFGGLSPEQSEALSEYLGIVMDDSQPSDIKANYLSIWDKLGIIYSKFKSELQQQGICYEGMAYRMAAEKILHGESFDMADNTIVFIGFNALNRCEKELFRYFKRDGKALFYWDYAPFFVNNPDHEAGEYIRENMSLFENALPREAFENSSVQEKEINLIAAPSTVAQGKLVPKILDQLKDSGARLNESTAIVLPNENLLIPTLQAIPDSIQQINITLGYPLKETPAFSLAEHLVKLQTNARDSGANSIKFYHKDVISVLNNPYIRVCEPELASELIVKIKQKNRIYPTDNMLAVSPLLSAIFTKLQPRQPITTYLTSICKEIAQQVAAKSENDEGSQHRVILEFLYALYKSLNRLHGVISTLNFEISNKVFLPLFRKSFHQERVSFYGEPLAGLQIMGFLETRALDFENVIILSFNDDILPGRRHPVSFITPSLRSAFELPGHKHQNALYAYYFYRLLNRAKRVYLVYSNRTEGLSTGEVSRFGLQLQMEQVYGKINTIHVGFDINITPPPPISITKNAEVLNTLIENLTRNGKSIMLSPSGLTSYISCPLRFYFRYCIGIKEEEELEEEIGSLEFGKIIHGTMENLYKDYANSTVTGDMVEQLIKDEKKVDDILEKVFYNVFLKEEKQDAEEELSGRNIIARNALRYAIFKMLKVDKARAPFLLMSQEKDMYFPMTASVNGTQRDVLVGGFIDRLEKKDDAFWVVDYKTGRKGSNMGRFSFIDNLFDARHIQNTKEVFQVFCYCLAVKHNHEASKVTPALWFVKMLKTEDEMKVNYKAGKTYEPIDDFSDFRHEFQQRLEQLIAEIFDNRIPFYQTNIMESCRICPYASICGRD